MLRTAARQGRTPLWLGGLLEGFLPLQRFGARVSLALPVQLHDHNNQGHSSGRDIVSRVFFFSGKEL